MRTYRIVILMSWALTDLLVAFEIGLSYLTSPDYGVYAWISFGLTVTLIICGCKVGIWRKFQQGGIAFQHPTRASRNKRLTKTLLFVSVLALMSWLPYGRFRIHVWCHSIRRLLSLHSNPYKLLYFVYQSSCVCILNS